MSSSKNPKIDIWETCTEELRKVVWVACPMAGNKTAVNISCADGSVYHAYRHITNKGGVGVLPCTYMLSRNRMQQYSQHWCHSTNE
uniref:Uncharacterized protein n=1 Tax=Arundo donax TaxID=35708 RepID=A0A0A9GL06_ARUDO